MMWNPSNFSPLVCHHPLLSRRNKRRRFRLQKNWKKKISFLKWCVCILIPNWCYPWDNFIFFLKFAGEKNKKQIHVQHLCRWWRRRSEKKNWGFSVAGLGRASVYSAALCADQYCVKVTMVSTTPESTTLLARSRTHTQAESERKRLLLLASKGTLANKVWPATFVNVFFHFSSSLDPVFCLCVCVFGF